ncbi:MAG: hypothetical protein COB93_01895 [Sneathiella sp.]|nr:MAG: hypothetical protein COB93_01895 [Sneathiella sp.]
MVLEEFQRYAVYFAPQRLSRLGAFGNSWLGFDPETGDDLDRPDLGDDTKAQIIDVTAAPHRYGFHGTLKPPFALRSGTTSDQLVFAIEELCGSVRPFDCGSISVRALGVFLALTLDHSSTELANLAALCVQELDSFRAQPSPAEIARRQKAGLTERQERFLEMWGYPYVFEEFRFHMTLTGELDSDLRPIMSEKLSEIAASALSSPLQIEDICLFGDPGDGQRFQLIRRFPLGNDRIA